MLAVACKARSRDMSSFGKLANYIEFGSGASMQVDAETGEVLARGDMYYSEAILDPRHAVVEMEAVALQSRRVEDPIFHYILAWQEGEKPTREQWESAVRGTQEAMCMADHQYIAALHKDGTTWHVHVMANRVSPDTYRASDLWKCHERLDLAIRAVEHVQDWHESPGLARWQDNRAVLLTKEEKKALREAREARQETSQGVAAKVEIYRDAESFAAWVKGEPAKALDAVMKRDGATWQDVHAELARFGLTLNRRDNGKQAAGYTVSGRDEHGKEIHTKASEAFRKHFAGKKSREVTDGKLGNWHTYDAPDARTVAVSSTPEANKGSAYTTGRTKGEPNDRAERKAERDRARVMLKAEYQDYRLAWKRDEQHRRTAESKQLKSAMSAIATRRRERGTAIRRQKLPKELRQVALSVIAAEAIQARAVVRAELSQEQQERRAQDYRAFVEERAAEGRPDALAQLRGFRYAEQRQAPQGQTEGIAGIAGGRYDPHGPHGFTREQPAELRLSWAVDRKRGHVVYSIGDRRAFVDEGRNVKMIKSADGRTDRDQVRVALQLAVQKFGPAIKLTGSEAFRRQTIEVAVASGMRVQFSAGADEVYRQQLVAAREGARTRQTPPGRTAPAPGKRPPVAAVPPPFARDHSRFLSELGELATDGGPIARPSTITPPATDQAPHSTTATPGESPHDAHNDGQRAGQQPDRSGTHDGRRAAAGGPGAGTDAGRGPEQHGKPHAESVGSQPPPEAKNRLRDVSELGVVLDAPGSEVLLPGDVSGDVEHQGTDTVHGVRWPVHRAGVDADEAPGLPAVDDPLARYRAAVAQAEAKGPLDVEMAKARLAVAEEYQAAGENLAHKSAEIMQAGEQRVMDAIQQRVLDTLHADRERARPTAPALIEATSPAITDADRKKADDLASLYMRKFRGLAASRRGGMSGYRDGQSAWDALPDELKQRIEKFNAKPEGMRENEARKLQSEASERYANDPKAALIEWKVLTQSKSKDKSQGHGK